MGLREIIIGVIVVVSMALGTSFKNERRAEVREARLQEKLAEKQLKQDLIAAKQKAQNSLEPFLVAAKQISGPDATLKVRVETSKGSEHIWVQDFKPTKFIGSDGVEFEGVLSNTPIDIPGMSFGDTLKFSRFAIEDWGLMVDGVGYGFFSARVLMPTLDASEAAGMAAFMSPEPLPNDWEAIWQALEPAEPYVEPLDRFMQNLADVPETWDRAMVLVYHLKIEKKPNGKTVGYAETTWVDVVLDTADGKLRGIPVKDALFNQANVDIDPIEFTKRDIKDWGFVEDGRGYGFVTLRERQGLLTAGQKQNLADFFSEELLPVGW